MRKTILTAAAALAVHLSAPAESSATELVVRVSGVQSNTGEVGCALHAGSGEFPMGNSRVVQVWHPADTRGVVCRFANVRPGAYAVSVSHDLNGNRRTDTNFLGIPTESWGVSRNVRPSMRAPTFEEARIEVTAGGVTTIEVRVAR